MEDTFQKTCDTQKVCLDRAGAHGLHVSPSPEALRATQKSNKNWDIFQNPYFSLKISKKYQRRALKGLQMDAFISGVAPPGRLLGHLWSPKAFYDTENQPTASTSCTQRPQQYLKNEPKSTKKMILKVPLKVNSLETLNMNIIFVPLAWRTGEAF